MLREIVESSWLWKNPKSAGMKKKWIKLGGELFDKAPKKVQKFLKDSYSKQTRKDDLVKSLRDDFDFNEINAIANYIDEVHTYLYTVR